jgi:hypothetical protein
MAVLIEAISVVMRGDAVLGAFGGDWEAFARSVPNRTLCADGDLARVGFMSPQDAERYVKSLEARGPRYIEDGQAKDMVVVDQLGGPAVPCAWVEFGHVLLSGNQQRVVACRLAGSDNRRLFKPDGWTFERSLSASFEFAPEREAARALKFLRHENGLDVYWSELGGREVYVGRTSDEGS